MRQGADGRTNEFCMRGAGLLFALFKTNKESQIDMNCIISAYYTAQFHQFILLLLLLSFLLSSSLPFSALFFLTLSRSSILHFVPLFFGVLCLMHTNCLESTHLPLYTQQNPPKKQQQQQQPSIKAPLCIFEHRVLYDHRNFHCDSVDSIVLRYCHIKYHRQKTSESSCMAMSNFGDRFRLSQKLFAIGGGDGDGGDATVAALCCHQNL